MAAGNSRVKSNNIVDSLNQRSLISSHERDYLQRVHLPDELAHTDRLYLRDLKGHFGCVNSLCFSSGAQEYLASSGDDKRILLWSMGTVSDLSRTPSPVIMKTSHHSNIFSVKFSCDNSYIYSAGNDGLILTQDLRKGDTVQTYQHIGAVYNVDAHPSSPRIISAATDDGGVYLIDTRAPKIDEEMIIDDSIHPFHSISFNPLEPHLVATGNEYSGAALYDLRNRKKIFSYRTLILPWLKSDIMSVNFNSTGSKLCVLPKAEPPKLFNTLEPKSPELICMDEKETYKNTVTLKTTCFAGDQDEYIVTGSDDFRLYWWKTKLSSSVEHDDEDHDTCGKHVPTYMVIPGHKSIVNQVCYSSVYHTLVSSGVEKTIKVWTQFPLGSDHTPHMSHDPPARDHYTYVDLLSMSLQDAGDSMSDSSENMEENGRSLAFFDHLIREEIMQEDESSSDNESEDNDILFHNMIHVLNHSPYSNSDSEDNDFVTYHRYSINSMDYMSTSSSNEDEERNPLCPENLHCTCVYNYSAIHEHGQEQKNGHSSEDLNGCGQDSEQSCGCGQDGSDHQVTCESNQLGDLSSEGGVAKPIISSSNGTRQCNHHIYSPTGGGHTVGIHGRGLTTVNEYENSLKALKEYFTKSTATSSGEPPCNNDTSNDIMAAGSSSLHEGDTPIMRLSSDRSNDSSDNDS